MRDYSLQAGHDKNFAFIIGHGQAHFKKVGDIHLAQVLRAITVKHMPKHLVCNREARIKLLLQRDQLSNQDHEHTFGQVLLPAPLLKLGYCHLAKRAVSTTSFVCCLNVAQEF